MVKKCSIFNDTDQKILSALPFILGILFIFSASATRIPWLIRLFGFMGVIKGVFFFLVPKDLYEKFMDWDPINQWLLSLRRMGITIFFVHHAGKGGSQRGTSAREDQLDAYLRLEPLKGRSGVGFKVVFEKGRSLTGEQKKPFMIELNKNSDGKVKVVHRGIAEDRTVMVAILASQEMTQKEISEKMEIDQSTVSRNLKKAIAEGLVSERPYKLTKKGEEATIGMGFDE